MVPHICNIRLHLLKSIVYVIRLISNRKYGFYFIYYVRFSSGNISLIHWMNIDHVLLQRIMIDTVVELSITACSQNYDYISTSRNLLNGF